jgi:hypothetical protein
MIKNSNPITLSLPNSNSNSYYNRKSNNNNPYYTFEYFFYNWYEPTNIKGVNFHDTDVLISTTTTPTTMSKSSSSTSLSSSSPNTLIITFAGTSSVADAFTNIQTFEPANHSRFFEPSPPPPSHDYDDERRRSKQRKWKRKRRYNTNVNSTSYDNTNTTTLIQGSLHRGFLNAYSRVERGSVLRLSSSKSKSKINNESSYNTRKEKKKKKNRRTSSLPHIIDGLHKRFGRCTAGYDDGIDDDHSEKEDVAMDSNNTPSPPLDKKRQRNKNKGGGGGGCRFTKKGEEIRPSIVLKELVNNALKNGYTVHVTGHSLGGALATLLVLNVLVNNNNDSNNDNDNDNSIDIPTQNSHQMSLLPELSRVTPEKIFMLEHPGFEKQIENQRKITSSSARGLFSNGHFARIEMS